MKIEIRQADAAAANLLAELGRATFIESFAAQNTPENMAAYLEKAFTERQLASELGDPDNDFFLAFAGGELAGYLKVSRKEMPEMAGFNALEINRIYVLQAFQGQKVGAALMQKALEAAEAQGADWLWLGVWDGNPKAVAFYQKWGFEKFGEHPFLLGTDLQTDWLMRRKTA